MADGFAASTSVGRATGLNDMPAKRRKVAQSIPRKKGGNLKTNGCSLGAGVEALGRLGVVGGIVD